MSIVFGFGEYHVRLTEKAALSILRAAADGGREAASTVAGAAAGGESTCTLYECITDEYHTVVSGAYLHVRTDHPMSPDGWAAWRVPWCATRVMDAATDEWADFVAVKA